MSQFLIIAEDANLFSENVIEHLNSLVIIIRQEIKRTLYKLGGYSY